MTGISFTPQPPDVLPCHSDRLLQWGDDLAVLLLASGEVGQFVTRHADLRRADVTDMIRRWIPEPAIQIHAGPGRAHCATIGIT